MFLTFWFGNILEHRKKTPMITSMMFPIRCFLLRWKRSTRLAIDPCQFPVEIEGFYLTEHGDLWPDKYDTCGFNQFRTWVWSEKMGNPMESQFPWITKDHQMDDILMEDFSSVGLPEVLLLVLPRFFTGLDWLVCGWPASQSSGGSVDVTCDIMARHVGIWPLGSMELGLFEYKFDLWVFEMNQIYIT